MKRLPAAALFAAISLACLAPASAQQAYNTPSVNETWCSSTLGAGIPQGCAPTVGDTPFAYDAGSTKTLTQVIAAPTAGSIRITYASLYGVESATGGTLEVVQGTGSNCASNASIIWAVALGASGLVQAQLGSGYGQVLIVKATYEVCFEVTAGTLVDGGMFGVYSVY